VAPAAGAQPVDGIAVEHVDVADGVGPEPPAHLHDGRPLVVEDELVLRTRRRRRIHDCLISRPGYGRSMDDQAVDAPRAAAGLTAATVAVVVWGLGPVIVKHIALPGMAVALHRLWIGELLTLAVLYLRGGRLTWAGLRVSLAGGVAFGLDIALFFVAVKRTSVADASIISALQPALLLLVVGRLSGERVRRLDVVWTIIAIGGVAIVVFGATDVAGGSLAGDALATGALAAWTWYFVASKQARQVLSVLEYQAALGLVAVVVVAPFALLSGQSIAIHDGGSWLWLALLVLGPGGGHLVMNWAHAHVTLTLTSLLTLLIPVVATVGAALFLGEHVVFVQVMGMIVVLGALAVVVAGRSRPVGATTGHIGNSDGVVLHAAPATTAVEPMDDTRGDSLHEA